MKRTSYFKADSTTKELSRVVSFVHPQPSGINVSSSIHSTWNSALLLQLNCLRTPSERMKTVMEMKTVLGMKTVLRMKIVWLVKQALLTVRKLLLTVGKELLLLTAGKELNPPFPLDYSAALPPHHNHLPVVLHHQWYQTVWRSFGLFP